MVIVQLLLNGLIIGSIYSVVALGFSVVFQTVRFLNFAHAGYYTLAGYFTFLFLVQFKFHPAIAFSFVCVVVVLVGCMTEFFVYRPLRRRRASSQSLLLASLGLYLVLQNLVSLAWGDDTKTIRTAPIVEGHNFLGARITTVQIVIVVVNALLICTLAILMRTKVGKVFRAVANDNDLACCVGISTDHVIMGAFGIASFMASVAAILLGFEIDLTPTAGFKLLVMAMIAAIIGGIHSFTGAALGGIVLGLAQNVAIWQLPSKWQDCVAFALLIIFLLFRPLGIAGRRGSDNGVESQ